MERAGTGGALFRNLYRDFLKEGAELLKSNEIKECYEAYAEIADLWNQVSQLFTQIGEHENIEDVNKASEILRDLSEKE